MASTFVNDLRLEEMATGENSGTWGTKTNTNLELIGEALGFGTEAITTKTALLIQFVRCLFSTQEPWIQRVLSQSLQTP